MPEGEAARAGTRLREQLPPERRLQRRDVSGQCLAQMLQSFAVMLQGSDELLKISWVAFWRKRGIGSPSNPVQKKNRVY
jgi:hypothetical protein